ncbi:hypothetical protein E2C01_031985 [Portunus trituberculatus]|uniref:Uncharacterized protein n=1 Tax=Portunus trituberculatus TaxID=210409 RepID=A0A5B7EZP9_PORTR|nr:hypothetical protein [Portunus trituberculatus]
MTFTYDPRFLQSNNEKYTSSRSSLAATRHRASIAARLRHAIGFISASSEESGIMTVIKSSPLGPGVVRMEVQERRFQVPPLGTPLAALPLGTGPPPSCLDSPSDKHSSNLLAATGVRNDECIKINTINSRLE